MSEAAKKILVIEDDRETAGLIAEGDQVVDLDSQLDELTALRDEGKIGAIGLSTVTLDQVRAAYDPNGMFHTWMTSG